LNAKIRLLPTDLKWLFVFSTSVFICTFPLIFAHEQLYENNSYTVVPGFIYGIIAIIVKPIESNENNLVNLYKY
jgi:hypothetical protein